MVEAPGRHVTAKIVRLEEGKKGRRSYQPRSLILLSARTIDHEYIPYPEEE